VLLGASQALSGCILGAIQRIGVLRRIKHVNCDVAHEVLKQRLVPIQLQSVRLAGWINRLFAHAVGIVTLVMPLCLFARSQAICSRNQACVGTSRTGS
jgi:hypothetical protein